MEIFLDLENESQKLSKKMSENNNYLFNNDKNIIKNNNMNEDIQVISNRLNTEKYRNIATTSFLFISQNEINKLIDSEDYNLINELTKSDDFFSSILSTCDKLFYLKLCDIISF